MTKAKKSEPAMTEKEKQYAISRVQQIASEKINLNYNKLCPLPKPLSAKDYFQAIKEGKAVLKNSCYINTAHPYVFDMFDFPTLQQNNTDYVKVQKANEEFRRKVNAEANKLKDQIMLGDSKIGLEMLAAFEANTF